MKTRMFAVILATTAGCGSSKPATTNATPTAPPTLEASASPAPAPPPAPTTTATKPLPAKPRPEIGAWGFDTKGMDTTVAPGASFYRYANGTWLKTTAIPADKSNYGMFTALADKSDERTRQIVETAAGAPGSDGQRIHDYYQTFMDEPAIEAKGLAPVQPWLDEIAAIKDTAGVIRQFALASRRQSNSPMRMFVNQDARDPSKYMVHIEQGGLGLPDRDTYDAKKPQFEPVRAAYKKYIAQMFTLIGAPNADQRAAAIYALEEKIAASHWSRTDSRDPVLTYNKKTIAELGKLAPDVDWKLWVKGLGIEGQAQIIVRQPPAITAIGQLVKRQPLAVWRDYLTLHALTEAAPYLPKKFVDAHFEMFDKALGGTPQIKERWKRAVEEITGGMGEAVGRLYVAKYLTPETKAHADQLVKNLLTSMGQRLDGLAWMGAETKAKAKAKLATYNPKIGYPKQWRDYSALTITAGDALGNALRTAEFEYNRNLAKLGQPLDRDEWHMTPMTINAYYNAGLNEIVFPAAILQPPFFDPNADDAINYGGIGAVIGHEISHGFDDKGSQFDATGTLKNWWTKDDTDKFKTATDKLVAQYDAYCPFPAANGKPAQCVQGKFTLGENIADLAGLTVAYNAYQLALGGKPAPVLDGLSGDQRFFLGWAQVWRRLYRDQELANRLTTDPHSPTEFRASVVRNLDAWYDAFHPKESDALYLAPDKRVRIW